MQRKHHIFLISFCLMALIIMPSCRKFVSIDPPINQLPSETVFTNDATALSAVNGIYSEMIISSSLFSSCGITLYTGMSADELYYYSSGLKDEFVNNQLTLANHASITSLFWSPAYRFIYSANLCIEQLKASTKLTTSLQTSLIGECEFLRAFCYFHLVNLFGDVPLILSSNYHDNASLPRSAASAVYAQIISDLKDADSRLLTTYPTAEKVRANKWTVKSLLAKVYLYQKDWANAELESSNVINSGIYSLESILTNVFLKGSKEAIFQLKTVNPSVNTWEGNQILPASSASTPGYLMTNSLLNSFEPGDARKTSWIGSRIFPLPSGPTLYYPAKYKVYGSNAPLTEYYMVFRLAEQYLIRAEARAEQNKVIDAQADINVIRNRAGLPNTAANDLAGLLIAIERERRIELFAEWGNRWFDLKRTGRANSVLGSLKISTWQPTDILWPIPQDQIDLNSALTQNPGY